jgi:hypothetical protein
VGLLVGLQDVEGLQYSLYQLILCINQLLKVDRVVGVVIVIAGLVVALVVPCVYHLMGWLDTSIRFYRTQLYAQGADGKKWCHFIYLNKDEVVDKVSKQSHNSHGALTSKITNIKTWCKLMTLDTTRGSSSENGIRRRSGCPLGAPQLNPGPWRR